MSGTEPLSAGMTWGPFSTKTESHSQEESICFCAFMNPIKPICSLCLADALLLWDILTVCHQCTALFYPQSSPILWFCWTCLYRTQNSPSLLLKSVEVQGKKWDGIFFKIQTKSPHIYTTLKNLLIYLRMCRNLLEDICSVSEAAWDSDDFCLLQVLALSPQNLLGNKFYQVGYIAEWKKDPCNDFLCILY